MKYKSDKNNDEFIWKFKRPFHYLTITKSLQCIQPETECEQVVCHVEFKCPARVHHKISSSNYLLVRDSPRLNLPPCKSLQNPKIHPTRRRMYERKSHVNVGCGSIMKIAWQPNGNKYEHIFMFAFDIHNQI